MATDVASITPSTDAQPKVDAGQAQKQVEAWQDQAFMTKAQSLIETPEKLKDPAAAKIVEKLKSNVEVTKKLSDALQSSAAAMNDARQQLSRIEGQSQGYLTVLRDMLS